MQLSLNVVVKEPTRGKHCFNAVSADNDDNDKGTSKKTLNDYQIVEVSWYGNSVLSSIQFKTKKV